MARITNASVSNFDQSKEITLLTQQGAVFYWPKVVRPSH